MPLPIGKNISHNLDDFLEDSDTDNEGDEKNHLKLILKPEKYLQKAEELYEAFRKPDNRKITLIGYELNFFPFICRRALISDGKRYSFENC